MKPHHKFRAFNTDTKEYTHDNVFEKMHKYQSTYIFEQYTGLKDKKGTKIYEGDLLEVCNNKNGLLKVEFKNQYNGGWVLTHHSTTNDLSLGARNPIDLEIIGNINQNKELLK